MKGFQRTRTKAQNLTEIVFKQDGFLTGLNLDAPKSDVGDTQLTALKNAIPYRDRIDARGGIKPQTEYLRKGFNEILASHVTLIDRHCRTSLKEVTELEHSERKSLTTIVDIYSKLEKNVSGKLQKAI